jgi:RimJ/RimL family protein N-acetyltransferase
MGTLFIRALEPEEWEAFREVRLQGLKEHPGSFFSNFAAEEKYGPEKWQELVRGPAHQVFGLFDGERLAGVTAAFPFRDDPSGETAQLGMSFIRQEYRGQKLTGLFYKARLDWIRAQPQFKRVVVSHRASNEASRRAIVRHGFFETRRVARTWPDGVTEDEWIYELKIR